MSDTGGDSTPMTICDVEKSVYVHGLLLETRTYNYDNFKNR